MSAEHSELKHLQRQIAESNTKIKNLNEEKRKIEEVLKKEVDIRNQLNDEVAQLKKNNEKVVVSEHAMLRYIERVMGVDLDEVKRKILPEEVEVSASKLGAGVFPADTHKVRIRDGVVVTILTEENNG